MCRHPDESLGHRWIGRSADLFSLAAVAVNKSAAFSCVKLYNCLRKISLAAGVSCVSHSVIVSSQKHRWKVLMLVLRVKANIFHG